MTMETHSVLNNLDYIILFLILLSGLLALMRGFVREIFSLVAWAGAYIIGTKFYMPAVPLAHLYIKNERVAGWVAMAGIFVASLILLTIIGHFVCMLVRGRALTAIDRSLGFLYGLARGVLVVSLVYLGAVMILWPDIDAPPAQQQEDKDRNPPPDLLVNAKTRPLMAASSKLLMKLVPKEMIDKQIKNVETQKQGLEQVLHQKALDAVPPPEAAPPVMAPPEDKGKVQDDINNLVDQQDRQNPTKQEDGQ
jgi:membrane protein required for colicin V production